MVSWRKGPSGGKVRKSGCEEKTSGSSFRLSEVHFSRSAMRFAFDSRLQVVLLDFVRVAE